MSNELVQRTVGVILWIYNTRVPLMKNYAKQTRMSMISIILESICNRQGPFFGSIGQRVPRIITAMRVRTGKMRTKMGT